MFGGGTNDCDNDGATDTEELAADTVPTNGGSLFCINAMYSTNSCSVTFTGSAARVYSLQCSTNLVSASWEMVNNQTNVPGTGTLMSLSDTNDAAWCAYRLGVSIP